MKINEYSGTLETYFETGMESIALILHDDRGLGEKMPNSEERFHSMGWTFFIQDGDDLTVYNKDKTHIWSGTIKKDRAAMSKDGYYLSIVPIGVSVDEWVSWFSRGYRGVLKRRENENRQTLCTQQLSGDSTLLETSKTDDA